MANVINEPIPARASASKSIGSEIELKALDSFVGPRRNQELDPLLSEAQLGRFQNAVRELAPLNEGKFELPSTSRYLHGTQLLLPPELLVSPQPEARATELLHRLADPAACTEVCATALLWRGKDGSEKEIFMILDGNHSYMAAVLSGEATKQVLVTYQDIHAFISFMGTEHVEEMLASLNSGKALLPRIVVSFSDEELVR